MQQEWTPAYKMVTENDHLASACDQLKKHDDNFTASDFMEFLDFSSTNEAYSEAFTAVTTGRVDADGDVTDGLRFSDYTLPEDDVKNDHADTFD